MRAAKPLTLPLVYPPPCCTVTTIPDRPLIAANTMPFN